MTTANYFVPVEAIKKSALLAKCFQDTQFQQKMSLIWGISLCRPINIACILLCDLYFIKHIYFVNISKRCNGCNYDCDEDDDDDNNDDNDNDNSNINDDDDFGVDAGDKNTKNWGNAQSNNDENRVIIFYEQIL